MGRASKTELRRWFEAGNVWVNGEQLAHHEPMDFPVFSSVIFPHGKRITLR